MLNLKTATALLALLSAFTSAYAGVATNQEIAQTYATHYMHQGQLEDAIDVLRQQITADPKDTSSEQLLGLIALERQIWSLAQRSFESVIRKTHGTDQQIARYYLAQSIVPQGKVDQAIQILAALRSDPFIGDSAHEAYDRLKSGSREFPLLSVTPESSWQAGIDLLAGYDSNVLLVADANLAAQTDTHTASPYTTIAGRWMRIQPRNANRSWMYGLNGSFTGYTVAEAKDFNTLSGAISFDSVPGQATLLARAVTHSYGMEFSGSYLNTSGYQFFNWTDSLRYRGLWRMSSTQQLDWELAIRYQKYSTASVSDTTLNDRSGPGLRPRLNYQARLGKGVFSTGLQYEQNFAIGTNYASRTWGVPVGYALPALFWKTTLSVNADFNSIAYAQSTTNRADNNYGGGVSLGRLIGKSFMLSSFYSYRRNSSNVDSAQYKKHSIALGASYVF